MKAVQFEGAEGAKRPVVRDDVATPKPGAGEVLIKIRAAGLNRADLSARPGVPGIEFAGEIVEVGAGVPSWKAGDKVMGHGGGGFAEYVAPDHRVLFPVPDGVGWEKAATYPVAINTMHNAVVTNGRLKKGEAVMFQGATSGVGILGIQVAKAMGARLVIGTSRSDQKLEVLKDFGMDVGINTSDADWPAKVREATGGEGVNLTVDMVSGPMMAGNMEAAAILGRIVNVGRLGGRSAPFDFNMHAMKRIDYIGVTFRSRSADEVADIVAAAKADLWELIRTQKIGLPVVATYALDDIAEAFAAMRRDEHLGKIVITV